MTAPATLVLGPLLRYVDETEATVWVETSAPAEVRVLGRSSPTFAVEGHHYALVVVAGLEPGSDREYSVAIDGVIAWPEPGDQRPAPRIRTISGDTEDGLDISFGSCRDHRSGEKTPATVVDAGVDALVALSRELQAGARPAPALLLLLGDQVYADHRHTPPTARDRAADQGSPEAPTLEAAQTFDEYAAAYQGSWTEPDVRWLLATVPTAMIFDDHEVRDNWNVSAAWRREVLAAPGWREQITGALMSYWLYQHLGNLSPAGHEKEGLWPALRELTDGAARLREFAEDADDDIARNRMSRWSYVRTFGHTRLVVLDTRSGRSLEPGQRSIFSPAEWEVVERRVRGDCDHLVVATSVPLLIPRSQHDGEAWNEALSEGAWGRRIATWSERLRRSGNLDQWAAFHESFCRLVGILGEVAAGRRGRTPRTVLVLSGDVHHAYVAPLRYPDGAGARCPVVQVVSSPFRNELSERVQRWLKIAQTRPARLVTRLLARSVSVSGPPVEWSIPTGPMFGNFVGNVTLAHGGARIRLESATTLHGAAALQPRYDSSLPLPLPL